VASNRGSNDKFGLSVGIDSTVIVVGAIGAQTIVNSTTYNSGATYVFEIDNSLVWNEVEMVNYSDISTGDFFGENVAISGEYIVSSARFEDEDATGNNTLLTSGSAYVFKTCFSTTSSIVEEACASYTSPSGNYVWTSSNTYSDTIPNTKGCDSVITINLTILTATTGVDVVSSCNSYTWIDGNTYAVSNNSATFNIVGAAANGCDSLVTLDLTISPAIDSTIDNTLMPVLTANQTGATYQWVDCDNGNAPILLATNQSYTATVNGNYAVEITVGLCMVTSECESVTGVGIKERTNSVLSIYPNPSSGIVNISNARDLVTVSFIDVMGKIVYTTSKTTLIDISQLNSGLYFVKTISKNNNVTVHKLYLQ